MNPELDKHIDIFVRSLVRPTPGTELRATLDYLGMSGEKYLELLIQCQAIIMVYTQQSRP